MSEHRPLWYIEDDKPEPTGDDRFRWWEGWYEGELWRTFVFAGSGVIIGLIILQHLIYGS